VALDFSTEVAFEAEFDWVGEFVPEEIEPLDLISDGADETHKAFMARILMKKYPAHEGGPSERTPTRRAEAESRLSDYLDRATENL
jgi:hypothetical protein